MRPPECAGDSVRWPLGGALRPREPAPGSGGPAFVAPGVLPGGCGVCPVGEGERWPVSRALRLARAERQVRPWPAPSGQRSDTKVVLDRD